MNSGPRAPETLALYVHIPFCETKCPYCDFNTYSGIEALMPAYVDALAHELACWGTALGKPKLGSVFFGGGTPSYIPTRDLTRLMKSIVASFDLANNAEVTMEANPGDTTRERLAAARQAGLNRISIGVQSLDDDELRLLGRRHDADQARAAVVAAREAGFDNVNVDLIFGLPNQMAASWAHTLAGIVAMAPDHISAYSLTIEPGTPLDADVAAGHVAKPDGDIAATMYEEALEVLPKAGYAQYEISNWCKAGRESTHNLAYWRSTPYLGVGPGAHSYLWPSGQGALASLPPNGIRLAAMKSPRGYVAQARSWSPKLGANVAQAIRGAPTVDQREELTEATAVADVLMMGLRLNAGIANSDFLQRFGMGIAERVPTALAECLGLGLVEWSDSPPGLGQTASLRLTDRARLVANEAFERFVSDAQSSS